LEANLNSKALAPGRSTRAAKVWKGSFVKQLLAAVAIAVAAPAWSQPSSDEPQDEAERYYLSQSEWQGVVLNASGHRLIGEAMKQGRTTEMTIIDVNGWADLPTSPASQQRVADARLKAVRDELIRNGVDAKDIAVLVIDDPAGWGPQPHGEQKKRFVLAIHY
jgi:hypothetical protein